MNKIIIAVLLLFFLPSCKSSIKEIQPEWRKLTVAVYASGTLQPEKEYNVVSLTDGYLQKVLVKEGDSVVAGQTLFQLYNPLKETQLHIATEVANKTAALTTGNAPQLAVLKNVLAVALARLQTDSSQYRRYQRLYEQNAVSKSSYENFWLQYQASRKEVSKINQQIKEERLSAALQMQQAKNMVTLAHTERENGNLKSQVRGIVFDVLKQEGDLVNPNQTIALVGSGKMIARLLVDEDDLSRVYQGQKILLSADAYPDLVFKAHIEKIYPTLNKATQSFRVDAVLDQSIPIQLYGLNIEANILVAENKKVLVIPKEAVLKGDTVLVKQHGEKKRVHITKGIEDNKWVEIKSGIDHSTKIILQ